MSSNTSKTPTDGEPTAVVATPSKPETGGKPSEADSRREQVRVDDSHAATCYANFCRVTGTSEELIVDFGLNTQTMGVPSEALVINQRIVLNYYTAKRLLAALQMSTERHEGAFGVLETDIRKRIQPAAARLAQPAPQS